MKAELTIQNQVGDNDLIGYLDNLGLTNKLTEGEKNTYLQIAKAFGLNPFKREVHVSKYGDTMSIITGYEVYIKRAERTGQLDGWSATTSGSVATNDLKATVTIYRKDRAHPFVWEADYSECVQTTNQGAVTKFWKKAAFMTKKVAISQGFRLCFSDELAGMPYTADEMPSVEDTTYEEVPHQPEVKSLPVMPDKAFGQLIDRLKKGEKGLVEKATEKFTFTQEQLDTIEGVVVVLPLMTGDEFKVLIADIAMGTKASATALLKAKRAEFGFTTEQETDINNAIVSLTPKKSA